MKKDAIVIDNEVLRFEVEEVKVFRINGVFVPNHIEYTGCVYLNDICI